jgi:hypothetical protein
MITIKIADKNGHTELMLEATEAEALLSQYKEAWIFVNNRLVQPNQIDYEEVEVIQIMPPLVGGKSQKQKNWADRQKWLTSAEWKFLKTLRDE